MCLYGFLKCTMFVFNGIIFLAGGAILGVGLWVKLDSGSMLQVLEQLPGQPEELNQLFNVGYLLIAVGAVLVFMGFLGCCGAICQNRCMLLLFFVIVLLVFLAEVAGAIVIFVFRHLVDELVHKMGTEAVKGIKKDYGKNNDITGLWNTTMDGLKCCGFNNYTDFTDSPFYNQTEQHYPTECCHQTNCSSETAGASKIPGCFPKLVQLIEEKAVILGAVALGIGALEIAAMVVSMMMYRHIGSK